MKPPPLLVVEQLQKHFDQGERRIEVLKSIDFTLERGKSAAIVGHSGCGKTTLLSLLAGLDQPTAGQVILGGVSLARCDESTLANMRAKSIGFVFQQFHLMPHLTALENISLPLELSKKDSAKERALEALHQVGLADRQNHFPAQLSGGEAQRVAIARALVTKPDLLLADEPSGNLDQQTGDQIADLLFNLVRDEKTALILVTHHTALAKRCDFHWLLDQGRLRDF